MKIALIPPIPELRNHQGDIHFALSEHVHIPSYQEFYRQVGKQGEFVILDNSAHEKGAAEDFDRVLTNAAAIHAREIVLPDVLENSNETVERTTAAIRRLDMDVFFNAFIPKPSLMIVPQGQTYTQWRICLERMLYAWQRSTLWREHKLTVGVSKDYQRWEGGILNLVQALFQYKEMNLINDVHLLGWPKDLWELVEVGRMYPWVRSTDSSKPFVYAMRGISLHMNRESPWYPHRSDNYWDTHVSNVSCLRRNIAVFRAAANGRKVDTVFSDGDPEE